VKLITGLGNPGIKYIETRHNVGFHVLDRIMNSLKTAPLERTNAYELYKGRHTDEEILCLYPLTYMNRSGFAVNVVSQQFNIDTHEIIIIYDDFNLPLGSIRIRPGGSAGGHKGLTSVVEMMQTNDIPRIRLGIYNEASVSKYTDAADFVLSAFEPDETDSKEKMIEEAHNAALMIVREGIDKAMNSFNKVVDTSNSSTTNKNME